MAAKKKKKKKKELKGTTKLDQLRSLAQDCNKAIGAECVYLGSQQRTFDRVETGILALDYVMGGGLVRGQMVQFTGAESSFKTTAALIAAAQVQKQGGTVVWVAGEGFSSKKWAKAWGVDLESLIIITADTGDVALETAVTMLETKLVDLMVFDSIQSLGTTREIEAGVDDESYAGAGAPQMWGRIMRKCYAIMNQGAETAMIAISQVRSPIGKYGVTEPEGSGIFALKHWKAIDIFFKRGERFYEGTSDEKRRLLAIEFKLRCMKNKTSVSEKIAKFTLHFDREEPGIDNLGTMVRLAKAYELVDVRGAWMKGYGLKAQGDQKFVELLEENPDVYDEMRADMFTLMQDTA